MQCLALLHTLVQGASPVWCTWGTTARCACLLESEIVSNRGAKHAAISGSMPQLERLHTLQLTGRLWSIPDSVRGLTTLKLLDVSHCELRQAVVCCKGAPSLWSAAAC